jgi:hypothetical protein
VIKSSMLLSMVSVFAALAGAAVGAAAAGASVAAAPAGGCAGAAVGVAAGAHAVRITSARETTIVQGLRLNGFISSSYK